MTDERLDQDAAELQQNKTSAATNETAEVNAAPDAAEVDQIMAGTAAGDEEADAGKPVELSWEEKLRDAEDRVLRNQAELENYRKRTQREMEQVRKYAAVAVVRDLLDVVDNLNLAIQSSANSDASAGLIQGVTMVAEQFENALRQHNCQRIKDLGEPFDPNVHEAIGQEPSEEYPSGTISRVTRIGYQIHDRVVRPSQVFVSMGPPETTSAEPQAVEQDGPADDNESTESAG